MGLRVARGRGVTWYSLWDYEDYKGRGKEGKAKEYHECYHEGKQLHVDIVYLREVSVRLELDF